MATVLIPLILSCFLQANPTPDEPKREKIRLPRFEQGALFVLRRQPNERRVRLERSEWVYVAILVRDGLDISYRKESIAGLAKLRGSDEATQILDGITRAAKAAGEETATLDDLIGLLMKEPAAELKKSREALLQLATAGEHPLVRQAGYSGMILADGQVEPAWQVAGKSKDGLADLLGAVRLITNPKLRVALHPKIKPLLDNAPSQSIRQSAIRAIASIPGIEKEAFTKLWSFVGKGIERDAAIEALLRLSPDHWPKDQVGGLVGDVLGYMRSFDPLQRNTPPFQSARQLAEALASVLPAAKKGEVHQALKSLDIQIVTVRTVPYAMKYDRVHMVVQAGQPIEITFENPDEWSHNLVFVAPGALAEIGIVASQMQVNSKNWKGREYVPDSKKVLFATEMVRNKQFEVMTIVAPDTVGEYPYLCTYPGHWVSMAGILHVVDDVEVWIAANPIKATGFDPNARGFVQAWSLKDFVGDLDKLEDGRSLENGKEMFTVASCNACHMVHNEGGVIGPKLGEVNTRFKPAEMLEAIIMPSKTINEEFKTWSFVLDDGLVYTGIITKEDEESVYLVENPLANLPPLKIDQESIEVRKASAVSTMPMGMLNTLTKDEILDLLAYIRSDKNPSK